MANKKILSGGGAPPLASAPEGPRRTPPNGGHPRNAPVEKSNSTRSRKLGEVIELISGQHIESSLYDEDSSGVPYLTGPADFGERSPIISKWTKSPKVFAKACDILLTVKGAGVGKSNLGIDAAIGRQLMALRPVENEMAQAFLNHFIIWSEPYISSLAQGATVPGIGRSDILDLEIILPPLSEQRRIAEVLDKAEGLRAKRREALREIDAFPQAIFSELFGTPETLFSKWPIKKIGSLLDFLTSGSRGWATHYAESGSLFLRIQNVRYDEMLLEDVAFVKAPNTAEAKRTRVEPGDVLLSITADLGRTAVVPDDIGPAFISQHLSILRTKKFVPRFLSAYFASPLGQRQVSGRNKHAVKAGLNFDDIRSFEVPVPPFPLQHEFARRIAAVEKLKAAHRASLAQLDDLFASLQHRAFLGEL